jgi:hypothetical protein
MSRNARCGAVWHGSGTIAAGAPRAVWLGNSGRPLTGRRLASDMREFARYLLGVLVAMALWLANPIGAGAQTNPLDPPIFDAHIHFNRDAWSVYSADDVLALLDQAGVRKAFVSSTPDDGTLLL